METKRKREGEGEIERESERRGKRCKLQIERIGERWRERVRALV